jgi:peptidyl-prolyl cis-trans isomerase D
MLAFFRHLANTWLARLFFLALAASFVAWGVSSKVGDIAGGDAVATVGGTSITPQQFDQDFQQGLRRATQRYPDPAQVPPGLRFQVAQQTLARLVTQAAIDKEVEKLGIAVPRAVRDAEVTSMPGFQGVGGNFDKNIYLSVLQSNNLTEAHFLQEVSEDIAKNQLLAAVQANAAPSAELTDLIYAYFNEKRTADVVQLDFSAAPLPPEPPEATLKRFYDNNLSRYTAPEYRRIKAVILSPATIGRSLPVSDADMQKWFDAHKSEFQSEETRSIQVITASKPATADLLGGQWKTGASWDALQAAAKAAGATASELDDTTKDGIPSPELAKAAFSAPMDVVVGPVTEALGVQYVKVTKITPAKNPTLDSMRDTVRTKVGEEKAADLVDTRAQKLQDSLAGGSHIDEIPTDLGAAGVEGTLDAQGNTPDGTPAPLPAAGALRDQIIADAFKSSPKDSVQLLEGPDHAWYAVQVESITKPAAKPFDQVRTAVLADWQHDQQRHTQETAAAKMVSLVKSGQTLQQAAWGSGLQVTRTPPLMRNRPTGKLPAEFSQAVFALKPGEAHMQEASTGFVVMTLGSVEKADPKTDPSGVSDTRTGLSQALTQDFLVIYANALRDAQKPSVNQALIMKLVQQPGE